MKRRPRVPAATALTIAAVLAVPLLVVFGLPQLLSVDRQPEVAETSAEASLGRAAAVEPDGVESGQAALRSLPFGSAAGRNAPEAQHCSAASGDSQSTADPGGWSLLSGQRGAGCGAGTAAIAQPSARAEGLLDSGVSSKDQASLPCRRAFAAWPTGASGSLSTQADAGSATSTSALSESVDWQSAFRQLQRLGVSRFRLEPGHRSGLFFFCCYVEPGSDPGILLRFESEAPDPLRAIQDVVTQVSQWYSQR